MTPVELHHGAATDVGVVREVNEDAFLADPPVFVVADGMGGHDRGDVASRIVIEEFGRLASDGYDPRRGPAVIAETLEQCQRRIADFDAHQRAAGAQDFAAGTTAVVALLIEQEHEPKWLLANLGDSRVYKYNAGVLEQVSVDHSVVQELVDAGTITADDAAIHPERHIITRALGGAGSTEADYFVLPLSAAERIVLCSDGVNGMIDDARIAEILAETEDPRDAADQVVAAAVAAGGQDNATAVVVDVVGLVHDTPYDSERQRVSLEEKLGSVAMSDEQPDTIWSYQPGDWFGIFGADLTLLLPGTERARVTGLWELVDSGAGFDQVLDGLLATGLSALPGFVLIGSGEGRTTRILLRGESVRAAVDTAEGPVALEGSLSSTWSERAFDGVSSITVVAGEPDAESRHLPIEQGLVRVSRVDRPEHSAPPVAETPHEVVPDVVPEVVEESSPLDDDADTHAQPSPYAAGLAEATGPIEPLPVSQQLPTLPPPPPLPPMAPIPVDPDHDGMTRAGLDAGDLGREQPGIPGQPQPPSIVRSVAKLVISNGETVDVDRVVLVGRAPEARRFTSTEQPRLVTVQSPLHEISSTHIEIRPGAGADHGTAVVTDMGSTNGTVLVQPGLGPEELKPGIAVQLIPGAVVNLGDGVTIQVSRP